MKNFHLILTFILSFTATDAFASGVVNRIVALVDDQAITQSDVDQALREGKWGKDRESVVKNLINNHILEAELDKEKITISDKEVDQAIQDIARQRGMAVEALRAEITRKGIPYSHFRKGIQRDLRQSQFMQKIIYPRVRVSDYDLQEYYKRNPNEFQGFSKIRFLEIFITPESVPTGQSAHQFASELVSQIRRGGSFQALASKYSKGAFASQGGDSGLLDVGSMRPDLVNLLNGMKLGEIAGPLPLSENTAFIFKVLDRQSPQPRPFEAVKEMIRQKFASDKVQDELENFIMEARSRHFVDIRS